MPDRGSRAPAQDWYNLVAETLALRGMTKTELSERSGVARPTIERWATGRRRPQAAPVNAVADALGIDRARALRLAGIITEAAGPPQREPEDWEAAEDDWEQAILDDPKITDREKKDIIRRSRRVRHELYPGFELRRPQAHPERETGTG